MLIKVNELKKNYDIAGQVVPILKGISFSVAAGEFVSLMGPSGSGKSTLSSILACLMPPSGGSYIFDGQEIVGLSLSELADVRNQKIGFVFQDYVLLDGFTAAENVMLPLHYRTDVPVSEARARAVEELRKVGLDHKADSYPKQLSGGQKQRVAIARALVTRPQILFADEPCGALDPKSRLDVLCIFQELNANGVTICMVTHAKDDAAHSKRIIVIDDGFVASDQPVDRPMVATATREDELERLEAVQAALKAGKKPKGAGKSPEAAEGTFTKAEKMVKQSAKPLPVNVPPNLRPENYANFIQLLSSNPTLANLDTAMGLVERLENPSVLGNCLRLLEGFATEVDAQDRLIPFAKKFATHSSWPVRLGSVGIAARCLDEAPKDGGAKPAEILFHGIGDPNSDVRHQSVVALVSSHKKIRPEDYGKVLMRGAGDEDPRVRADSARGFRHLGLERATDPLVGLIKDQDGRVRANALNSLAQLWKKSGAPMTSLAPRVSFLLEDVSNRVVADAAIALSEADPRRVREAVIRLVHSHSPLHIASGIYAASKVCPEVLTQNFDRLIALPHKPVQEALRKYFRYGDAEATGILKAGKTA